MQIHVLLKKNCPKIFFHQTMKKRNFLDLFFVLQRKKSGVLKPNEKDERNVLVCEPRNGVNWQRDRADSEHGLMDFTKKHIERKNK